MKINCNDILPMGRKKMLHLIMKMFILLFCTTVFSASHQNIFSQDKTIHVVSDQTITVDEVFDIIMKSTTYTFMYPSDLFKDTPKIELKKGEVKLNELFKKVLATGAYECELTEDKTIVIKKAPKTPKQTAVDRANAQYEVSGVVTDIGGNPLPGANILVQGTTIGAQTDFDGMFTIDTPDEQAVLVVSFVGYKTQEVPTGGQKQLTIVLMEDTASLDDVILVGSRGKARTAFASPVAVDNFKIKELRSTGRGVLDEQLSAKVPSYTSTQQPVSDAGAHFSPADLRGLLPSRTLVLVNGKRKNASALVYSYVTPGRGEVGVDMKSIPGGALERVEVLRDGAAAQYGSDAVAGVVNLVLKKDTTPFVNLSSSITTEGDGEQYQLEAGFGINLRDRGYANFTLNYFDQKTTQRAGTITSVEDEANYWGVTDTSTFGGQPFTTTDLTAFLQRNPSAGFQVGIPEMTITNFTYNMGYTLDEETSTEVYSFGSLMNRTGSAPQFARVPYWVPGFEQIYPGQDFFLAKMAPQIQDYTFTLGVQTTYNNWDIDLSSTIGRNRIDYYIKDSFNQSFGASSPSDFYNGAHQFGHVVNNFDVSRTFDEIGISSLSLAFGAEHRTERFVTEQGEFASYGDGTPDDPSDRTGSESFGGFSPENESDDYRNNLGVYTDITADITDNFLIGGALRYENYSDFGANLSWKANARWKFFDDKVALRASVSSGFRAPSLHQVYYTATTTTLTSTGIQQNGILNNADPALRALGVGELEAETSFNIGAGFTYRITKNIGLTVDAYQIDIDDRIVLSGQVTPTGDATSPIDQTLASINVGSAGFFLNAIETRTKGIDVVFTYDNIDLGRGTLSGSIAANFNETEVTGTNFPTFIEENGLGDAIFTREDVSRVETWRPRRKIIGSLNYKINRFSTNVSVINHGAVEYDHPTNPEDDAEYGDLWVTDLSLSYGFTDKINLTVGVNNLFDVFPDTFADAYSDNGGTPNDRNLDFVGRFKYPWQTTQIGLDGTRIFSKLSINF